MTINVGAVVDSMGGGGTTDGGGENPASVTHEPAQGGEQQPPAQQQQGQQQQDGSPPPEGQQQPQQDDRLDRSWGALTRAERQIQQRARELKELEARVKHLMPLVEKEEEFRQNPKAVLDYWGYGERANDVLKALLGDKGEETAGKDPSEMTVEDRIALIEKQQADRLEAERRAEEKRKEEEDRAAQEAREREHQEAFEEYVNEAKTLVEGNADKYPTLKASGEYDAVLGVLQEYYQRHNEIIPVDKACDAIEDYLTSHYRDIVSRSAAFKDIIRREESPDRTQGQPTATKSSPTTLTHRGVASHTPVLPAFNSRFVEDIEAHKSAVSAKWQKYVDEQKGKLPSGRAQAG